MFNVTTGTIILSLATIPELIAFFMSIRGFMTKKYSYYLFMASTWFFMFLGTFLLSISYLTLDTTLYRFAVIVNVPITYSIMVLVDSVSRSSIDPRKVLLTTFVSTSVIIYAFEPNAVVLNTSYFGEQSPALSGNFDTAGSLLFILSGVFWVYYMAKLYLNTPKSIKRDSSINLIGALIAGPGAALAFASGLVWFIPGLDYVCISIGALACAYAFSKQPKLGYVLPFKVYRLLTINMKTGISLFSHNWDTELPFDSQLFSPALNAITNILNESLAKGSIKEIEFEQGTLIIHQFGNYPVFFVLLANESRPILKDALQLFSQAFMKAFSPDFIESNLDLTKYNNSEYILTETFPFVVSYI